MKYYLFCGISMDILIRANDAPMHGMDNKNNKKNKY